MTEKSPWICQRRIIWTGDLHVPWLFIGWQTEQRTIRHRTTQQKPTSNVNTIRFYLVAYGQPLSVRVAFDLQYCGFYTRFDHNFLERLVICIEITDSQCTYFSHITPCTHKIAGWLVNKSNCMCSNILSIASNVLLSPYSVGQSFEVIQIFSREIPLSFTARPTPASSLCMSSIDMSITDLQSSKARLFTYRTGWLHKSSQTELRHQHTIIELYHRYISDSFSTAMVYKTPFPECCPQVPARMCHWTSCGDYPHLGVRLWYQGLFQPLPLQAVSWAWFAPPLRQLWVRFAVKVISSVWGWLPKRLLSLPFLSLISELCCSSVHSCSFS